MFKIAVTLSALFVVAVAVTTVIEKMEATEAVNEFGRSVGRCAKSTTKAVSDFFDHVSSGYHEPIDC